MLDPRKWTKHGACVGTPLEWWFPEDIPDRVERTAAERQAKATCAGCPVRRECLLYGVRHERWGIWGGETGPERRELRSEFSTPLRGVSRHAQAE